MKLVAALVFLFETFLFGFSAKAASWNGYNNPANFGADLQYQLNMLPMAGKVPDSKIPWSETYWPSNKGSINIRWNAPGTPGFDYKSPSFEEVKKMSKAQLAQLSPSEKYDLFMGHYDYRMRKAVASSASKRAPDWAGICTGWSLAALHYREPKAVEMMNPDGIVIPFGSSDVKGLMSFYLAFSDGVKINSVGQRCRKIGRVFGTSCSDINAGAFHIILSNQLGIKHVGFIADVDSNHEIWNQPVYAYETKALGSADVDDNKDAALAIYMETQMTYTDELDNSEWQPVVGTELFQTKTITLKYSLELNRNGNIIGGRWYSGNFPDFVWKAFEYPEFKGEFEGLNQIYQASIL